MFIIAQEPQYSFTNNTFTKTTPISAHKPEQKLQYDYQNKEEHDRARLVEALRYTTGIFHSHNPSGRTLSLESSNPRTDVSTKNIFWEVNPAGA
jgi:hypothetical protein